MVPESLAGSHWPPASPVDAVSAMIGRMLSVPEWQLAPRILRARTGSPMPAKPAKCNPPRTRLNRVWKAAPSLRVSGLARRCSFVQTCRCCCSTLTSSAPLGAYLPKTLPLSEQPSTPHRAVLVHPQGCGLWLALCSGSTSHHQEALQPLLFALCHLWAPLSALEVRRESAPGHRERQEATP